ncbi:MAG: hypothetical protein Q7T94_10220 [Rugosibacter sp.]|nr:hypothetical protein [Rugosibacter sp.]
MPDHLVAHPQRSGQGFFLPLLAVQLVHQRRLTSADFSQASLKAPSMRALPGHLPIQNINPQFDLDI